MRNLLLISNALIAVIFLGFFAYTFLSRQHIDSLAREFVTVKTQKLVTPGVDAAEQALRGELAQRLLTKNQKAAVEAEIAEFREQPERYIHGLTSADVPLKPDTFIGALSEKLYGWKERIRAYYNKILRRLLIDLRIFSGSNVVFAALAFALAYHSPSHPTCRLTAISGMLILAVGCALWMYIDNLSFFTILLDAYLGWWYPVIVAVLFGAIYLEHACPRAAATE